MKNAIFFLFLLTSTCCLAAPPEAFTRITNHKDAVDLLLNWKGSKVILVDPIKDDELIFRGSGQNYISFKKRVGPNGPLAPSVAVSWEGGSSKTGPARADFSKIPAGMDFKSYLDKMMKSAIAEITFLPGHKFEILVTGEVAIFSYSQPFSVLNLTDGTILFFLDDSDEGSVTQYRLK